MKQLNITCQNAGCYTKELLEDVFRLLLVGGLKTSKQYESVSWDDEKIIYRKIKKTSTSILRWVINTTIKLTTGVHFYVLWVLHAPVQMNQVAFTSGMSFCVQCQARLRKGDKPYVMLPSTSPM